jgi:hypothetical protein
MSRMATKYNLFDFVDFAGRVTLYQIPIVGGVA